MPSVDDLIAKGFVLQWGYTTSWSMEEETLIKEFFHDYLADKVVIKDSDPYWHISRYVLKGSKTREEV